MSPSPLLNVLNATFWIPLLYEGEEITRIWRQMDYDEFKMFFPENMPEADYVGIWNQMLALCIDESHIVLEDVEMNEGESPDDYNDDAFESAIARFANVVLINHYKATGREILANSPNAIPVYYDGRLMGYKQA